MPLFEIGKNPFAGIGASDPFDGGFIPSRPSRPAHPRSGPGVTDAVIAAVKKMQAVAKGPSSIMGADLPQGLEERFNQTNKLIQKTNQSVLHNEKALGPAHKIRWGLFAHDWTTFQDELTTNKRLTEVLGRRHEALRKQAIEWELETNRALKIASELEEKEKPRSLPWKKILLIGGASIAAFLGLRYWLARNEYVDDEQG